MSSPRDLAAVLAAEIRAAVAETSRPQPPPVFSGGEEDLARAASRRCEAHLTPTIPASAPLSGAKRAAVRLLRFLWRDQSAYNALMLETANQLIAAVAGQRRALDDQTAALHAELLRTEQKVGRWLEAVEGWRESSERRESIRDGRLARLETSAPASGAPAATAPGEGGTIPAGVYSLFEERFRGDLAAVARKQRSYVELLRGLPGPVLDVGCGRGEFLSLLRAEGIPASGIELSPIAAAQCLAAGLDVVEADAAADLPGREPGRLGGITAFQVVEHWRPETLFAFLLSARRAVAPGGVLIAETINSDSLSALKAFFLDPSHVRPIPPETLHFMVGAAGFVDASIEYRGELPPGERLAETTENDRILNRLLFGPQDYAVIARVPPES